jgi:hypothetical protein
MLSTENLFPSLRVIYSHKYSFRPEYQGYLLAGENDLCVGLITVPPSCADSLEDREPQPPAAL